MDWDEGIRHCFCYVIEARKILPKAMRRQAVLLLIVLLLRPRRRLERKSKSKITSKKWGQFLT